jgi:hypothetical protein
MIIVLMLEILTKAASIRPAITWPFDHVQPAGLHLWGFLASGRRIQRTGSQGRHYQFPFLEERAMGRVINWLWTVGLCQVARQCNKQKNAKETWQKPKLWISFEIAKLHQLSPQGKLQVIYLGGAKGNHPLTTLSMHSATYLRHPKRKTI